MIPHIAPPPAWDYYHVAPLLALLQAIHDVKRLVGSPLHKQPKTMTMSPNSTVANSLAADRWAMSLSLSHYWLLVAPAMCRSTTDSYSCIVISCLWSHCHCQMTAFPRLLPCLLALTFFLHDPWVWGRQISALFRTKDPPATCIKTPNSHVSLPSPLDSSCGTAKGGISVWVEDTWIFS